ncbi:uncharacterized protein LOC131942670 isoform X2 [Physella acuta]|nr:uncharacterized protein LOC131942670 isoform X2 [Physella acuta]XP_059158556.1 uncharacterized protein LOC131942670 isoform X2 [Physella acuta]XP_059158557.1 uncharacterized protein LOC131942670 isoform X2 [Physella acuta]
MTRDFQNGTTCTETRTTSNCLCLNSEGRGVHLCPIDDDHRIYNLGGHRQYTCEPTCSFPWCGNRTPSPNGPVIATTSEQNSHSFGGKTFTRIECRCPRHHRVNPQASHNQQRATQYAGHRFNTATRHYSTLYSCNFLPHEDISDPCAQ